jgi:poly(hydroxyalkanoate) granule-associated protein
MAKKKKNSNTLPNDAQEAAQRLFFAGVGALSLAEEEGSKLFKKLVKRGKKYDGDARKEVAEVRAQLEGRVKQQVDQVRSDVDAQTDKVKQQTDKVKKSVDARVGRVRQAADARAEQVRKAADGTFSDLERRVQEIVTGTLRGLGIPTRDEVASLRKSVRELSKNLDALKHERTIATDAQPAVAAVETENGWYDVLVHGTPIKKVHGEEEAVEVVARLQQENAALTDAERQEGAEAVKGGGGWYQITFHGLVVDKVQGKDAAEANVERLNAADASLDA